YQRLRRQQSGSPAGYQPYDGVLMLLAALEDPGLTVLPTHRVTTTPLPPYEKLRALFAEQFDLHEFAYTPRTTAPARAQFIEALRTNGHTVPTFGVALKGTDSYLTLALKPSHRPRSDSSPRAKLDVSLLQQLVVTAVCRTQQEQEAILYTKDDYQALD